MAVERGSVPVPRPWPKGGCVAARELPAAVPAGDPTAHSEEAVALSTHAAHRLSLSPSLLL